MSGSSVTQAYRSVQLKSPLGDERLIFLELSGTEHVNELGQFRLTVLALKSALSESEIKSLMGENVEIILRSADSQHEDGDLQEERQIVQTCFGMRYLGQTHTGWTYELELRPWIWIMSLRQTSRMFYNMTVGQIIEKVFNEHADSSRAGFISKIGSDYPTLEYTVQYNESDLTFMRRLLEEFGINFHIAMRNGDQDFVLTDDSDGFDLAAKRTRSAMGVTDPGAKHEVFETWNSQRHVTEGSVRMGDYNFETPNRSMEVRDQADSSYSPQNLERYEYPGRYLDPSVGSKFAKRRLEALKGVDDLTKASGYAPTLGAGMRFTMQPDFGLDIAFGQKGAVDFVVTSATHHYVGADTASGGRSDLGYRGEYTLVKKSVPIVPARVTPRPYLRGPQSAKVAEGADGAVDHYGRIKVTFPWGGNSPSMYCRVSQLWAGSGWGAQFIPRAGMEVLVDFMEGDPDRPVIVGCLYNDENEFHSALPKDRTRSGFRSQTMDGDGHNSLIFEDKSGEEQFYIHAQRDMGVDVLNDEIVSIGKNSTSKIGADDKREVVSNQTIKIGANQSISVDGKISIESLSGIEIKVGASKIVISASEIKITAPMITMEANGVAQLKGTITKVLGDATMVLQAPLVKIN